MVSRASGRGLEKPMHPSQLVADAKAWAERITALERLIERWELDGLPMPSGIEIPEPGTIVPMDPINGGVA